MFKRCFLLFSALFALAASGAYSSKITLDKPDGFYKSGETATCTVQLFKDGEPLSGEKVFYLIRWENKTIKSGIFVTDGKPKNFSYKSDKPGWIYFGFQVLDEKGKPRLGPDATKHKFIKRVTEIGAIFDADKLRYTAKRPADFDKFWAERKAEVAAQDLQPKLVELNSRNKEIKLFAFRLSCPRGIVATGYFAYPANAKPKSLPAYISYLSWANTDANRWSAVHYAKSGMLAMAATWHGLPVGKSKKYYEETLKKTVKGGIPGIDDRDNWVMGEIPFRVLCELKFLKSQPLWDGKNLISVGGSLGGAQSAWAAALDPDVTLAVINVPCFCEFDGAAVGRRGSIPRGGANHKLAKSPKALAAQSYFDCVLFAPMIKCETYVCTGFSDEACHPSSVYAFYNALPQTTPKAISTDPKTGHFGTTVNTRGNSRFKRLLEEIKIGEIPSEVK